MPRTSQSTIPLPAVEDSRSIPEIFRPPINTSFGHLQVIAPLLLKNMVNMSRTARAATKVNCAACKGAQSGRRTIDAYNFPGSDVHTRPRRPLPAVWRCAQTSVPSAAPEQARRLASSLVLSTASISTNRYSSDNRGVVMLVSKSGKQKCRGGLRTLQDGRRIGEKEHRDDSCTQQNAR